MTLKLDLKDIQTHSKQTHTLLARLESEDPINQINEMYRPLRKRVKISSVFLFGLSSVVSGILIRRLFKLHSPIPTLLAYLPSFLQFPSIRAMLLYVNAIRFSLLFLLILHRPYMCMCQFLLLHSTIQTAISFLTTLLGVNFKGKQRRGTHNRIRFKPEKSSRNWLACFPNQNLLNF